MNTCDYQESPVFLDARLRGHDEKRKYGEAGLPDVPDGALLDPRRYKKKPYAEPVEA